MDDFQIGQTLTSIAKSLERIAVALEAMEKKQTVMAINGEELLRVMSDATEN